MTSSIKQPVKETVEFVASGQYTLPSGYNPLPTGFAGRVTALKWLATGKRPSIEGFVSKAEKLTVYLKAGGGSGGGGGASGGTSNAARTTTHVDKDGKVWTETWKGCSGGAVYQITDQFGNEWNPNGSNGWRPWHNKGNGDE